MVETIWRHPDDWTCDIFLKDTPADKFGVFGELKALWDSRRSQDGLPAWRNFDFEDFNGWYGWMVVEDIIPGPTYDAVYRLWGTEVVRLYGTDLTGQRLRETDGTAFTQEEFDLIDQMLEDKSISLCTGPMQWQQRSYIEFSRVSFPLADDGETIDKYLTVFRRVE